MMEEIALYLWLAIGAFISDEVGVARQIVYIYQYVIFIVQ